MPYSHTEKPFGGFLVVRTPIDYLQPAVAAAPGAGVEQPRGVAIRLRTGQDRVHRGEHRAVSLVCCNNCFHFTFQFAL